MKRLLFVVLLLAGAVVVPVGPAQAAACSGTSGVTVVVQFPDRTEVGCAAGDPSDGFAALKGAGFAVTIVTRFPGAVCRINGYPSTPCDNMPPANAYWTYYQARPGGSWSKSNYGAASTNPKPGSFEGWRFGDGRAEPDYAIPPAPSPTPRPTAKPTARPTGGTSGPVEAPDRTVKPTGQSSGPSAGPSGSPSHDVTATATDGSSPSAEATSGPGGTAATAPTATKDEADDSSGGLHWIWGVALVGVLGAAAATTAARRRRS